MTTRIEMINRALQRIGEDPLQSEAVPGAGPYLAVYQSMIELFAAQPWSFGMTTRRLPRLSLRPEQHWTYAFQLPAAMMASLRAVYPSAECRTPTTSYDIEADGRLLTDHPDVWIKYRSIADPARWPGDFREAFTLGLMSELALTIREDRQLRDKLRQDAFGSPSDGGVGGALGTALANDNQALPSTVVGAGVNPLLDVR